MFDGGLTGGENAECCLNLSQWECGAALLVLWCEVWQSHIWGRIWLQAWPCWRYTGTDWVKCGGEHFPICGCSRSVCCFWQSCAWKMQRGLKRPHATQKHRDCHRRTGAFWVITGVSHRPSYGFELFDHWSLDVKQSHSSWWCHLESLNSCL